MNDAARQAAIKAWQHQNPTHQIVDVIAVSQKGSRKELVEIRYLDGIQHRTAVLFVDKTTGSSQAILAGGREVD